VQSFAQLAAETAAQSDPLAAIREDVARQVAEAEPKKERATSQMDAGLEDL
jgi:hypothetical protein